MKKTFTITLALIGFVLPQMAFAWGMTGHRVIGKIAEMNLGNHAIKNLNQVLDNASVAMVSNWGDFIKSDSALAYTAIWHYKDLPSGLTRDEFNKQALTLENGEVVYRVLQLINELKAHPDNSMDLKILIHLIGDMHQPLHMGHPEDKGGNMIKIRWMGRETNLHSLWDSGLIDMQQLSYREYADYLYRTHKFDLPPFKPSMVLDWAWGTYQAAQVVYNSVDDLKNPFYYDYKYLSLLESRLTDAGDHLAIVLNYLYNK
jgi:hypothetical protein